ncbi:MAG: NAD-dependent epimerase/dehydratase family protein [Gemmatimonadales bacterium]
MTSPETQRAWLVTGATGFLGRHVLDILQSRREPARVLALVRDRAAWSQPAGTRSLTRVEPIEGDVTETGWWKSGRLGGSAAGDSALGTRRPALGGILHLAAMVRHRQQDAEPLRHVNVDGTHNMVRLAAHHRCRLVLLSTSGTVGCFRAPGAVADEAAPYCEDEVCRWPYYRSKIEAEREGRRLAGELGVELVIIRPPVLLGPGDPKRRSVAHVERLLDGKLPFLIEGGMHYADVRDVAAAVVRVMEVTQPKPVYHLPGTMCTITEFYRDVADLAGMTPPKRIIPYRLAWTLAWLADRLGLRVLPAPALVEMAAHHWGLGSRYAEADLGYRSRPGRETLRDTIAWLRKQGEQGEQGERDEQETKV